MNTKVSIGLPVYNGALYIGEAIDSILSQTYTNFELIISDNASIDNTKRICLSYAEKDNRILISKNNRNLGSSKNYIKVFKLSTGKYFKWVAHDDILHPDFLKKCVNVLNQTPDVVLCYSKTISIDGSGKHIKEWDPRPKFSSFKPPERFKEVFTKQNTFPIWGLIHSNILSKTPLLGNYPAHDRPLLAELSLYGRFFEIPEFLFFEREHQERSIRRYPANKPHDAIEWYDPKLVNKIIFPNWRLLFEYFMSIIRPPISFYDRLLCISELFKWTQKNKDQLLYDIAKNGAKNKYFGNYFHKLFKVYEKHIWMFNSEKLLQQFNRLVQNNSSILTPDEKYLDKQMFSNFKILPFLEKSGEFYGLPNGDENAIEELERMKKSGAQFFCLAWPSFWWEDHYSFFCSHIKKNYRCIINNKILKLYDLRFNE